MLASEEAGPEGLGRLIQSLEVCFYADDSLIALPQAVWLQCSFEVLTDLFDHVGLRTNVNKTVRMVFQPCPSPGDMSVEAYTLQMTGEGTNY